MGFGVGAGVLWAVWGVRCYYRTIDWADSEAIAAVHLTHGRIGRVVGLGVGNPKFRRSIIGYIEAANFNKLFS